LSQSGQFRHQLEDLMAKLNSTVPQYIRCIKPNSDKLPNKFDAQLSLQQLRYAGVFEAVFIRKQGYPFRYTHENFYKRFRMLGGKGLKAKVPAYQPACTDLLSRLDKKHAQLKACQLGVSMVLYRADQHRVLELARNVIIEKEALTIQRFERGRQVRKMTKELKRVRVILREALRSRDLDTVTAALEQAKGLAFKMMEHRKCEDMKLLLEEEKRINAELVKLSTMNPDEKYDDFDRVVKRLNVFIAKDALAFQTPVALKVRQMHASVTERRAAKKELLAGIEAADKAVLEMWLKKLPALKAEWGDFCAREEAAAVKMLERIKDEEAVVKKVLSSVTKGAIKGVPGALDASRIDTRDLDSAIAAAEAFGVRTAEGRHALEVAAFFSRLRKAIKAAVTAQALSTEPKWLAVQKMVGSTTELLKGGGGGDNAEELALIKDDLTLRAAVDDINEKLAYAIDALDEDWLVYALEQSHRLSLDSHPQQRIRDRVRDARDTLAHISVIKTAVTAAIKSMDLKVLNDAIAPADAMNYNTPLIQKAKKLREQVQELTNEVHQALVHMDADDMLAAIDHCSAMGLKVPELKECHEFLALPEDQRLQRQLKAAVLMNDAKRVTKITIRIKV
jgi:hypothetical protein